MPVYSGSFFRRASALRGAGAAGALAALLAFAPLAFPQHAAAPLAPSRAGLKALDEVPRWTAPPVDAPQLLRQDDANRFRRDTPLRIGFPMTVDLAPSGAGLWEDLADGGRVWRLVATSKGALWIALGFDVYRLQPGGTLWVYDPALTTVMGPYTARDVRDHGQLWIPPVEGDSVVVEIDWAPKNPKAAPDVHLGTVSHGYKPFGPLGQAAWQTTAAGFTSGPCNIDVTCPLGADWQNEKRGVVLLLSGGSSFCSASLINTTADDCRPYVLTAYHCQAGPSTVFGFNWERYTCNGGAPPSPTISTVSGAAVLAGEPTSDFTLLQMDSAPPESFNAHFNGWRRSAAAPAETHVIHHPSGDLKKISYSAQPAVDGPEVTPKHWRVEQYTAGTTEPGSSGAPLFDENHLVVGQLHWGTSSCTSLTWDEYGQLGSSWDGAGTPATRLSDWLDPGSTGQPSEPGVDQIACILNPVGVVTLERSAYACTDSVGITLRDGSLRGNSVQLVAVSSTSEPTPEVVTLTARRPQSTYFDGSIPLAPSPPVHGDGVLSVGDGDVVTVLYVDADNGSGTPNTPVTATASIDCLGPVFSSIRAENIRGATADIAWSTDEPADSQVAYGTAPPPTSSAHGTGLVVDHRVTLTGLSPCTTYYYAIGSTDALGNASAAANGGLYYTFTTAPADSATYSYSGAATPIPGTGLAAATTAIDVPDDVIVAAASASVNIVHSFDSDLTLRLVGPDGSTATLADRRGAGGDNFTNTVFDDAASAPLAAGAAPFAGAYRPETPLAAFNGKSARGQWTLSVVDNASGDTGAIETWSLTLAPLPRSCAAAPAYSGARTADVCNGDGAGGGDGRIDPGETVALAVAAQNVGLAPVTGLSAHLTTATPGVTITDDHVLFPDLTPGARAFSDPDAFEFELDPAFPCGQSIDFTADFTAREGAWSSSFSLPTGGPQVATTLFPSTEVPRAIFDNTTLLSSVSVDAGGVVFGVKVNVSIQHSWDGDLVLTLIAPTGARILLTSRRGGSGDNYQNTTFDDLAARSITAGAAPFAGSFRPEAALSALKSIAAAGVWKLEVRDEAPPDTGTLTSWSLTLTTSAPSGCANCSPTRAGEARNAFWPDDSTLAWSPAVRATQYTVHRGAHETLPQLLTAEEDSCLRLTTASPTTGPSLTETPPPGTFYWYLVQAHNDAGAGTAGNASAGPRILDSGAACP